VVSAGTYLLGAALLAALVLSLAFSAHRLRSRLLPDWSGPPALLVESILAIALLIWLAELLGIFSLLYAGALVALSLLLAGAIVWRVPTEAPPSTSDRAREPDSPGPGPIALLVMVGVIAVVVAHWGLTIDSAVDRGIFNFDSLWYHMPFAADIAQSHSVLGLHHFETVFTTWFYPENSELLHGVGILLIHRDTLSLFLNLGWLAIALLAAWVIGRPYGRGHLSVVAVAILLECHTLVVREPGAAKDDLATAAPLLAAIAILVTAWSTRSGEEGERSLPLGWPLAAAGLAVGLAAGTKFTVFAIAAALTFAVLALAPSGRRLRAAAWWFVPALAAGGFWYLRNLIAAGNPLPVVAHLGPITLPHPEGLHTLRPDFSIAHYATDTGVWSGYFAPGLHDQFGLLWPLVVAGAVAGAVLALVRGRDRVVRCAGAVALFGMAAYLFTPLSAAGADGAPVAFSINVRYVVPAMLIGLAVLPLPRFLDGRRAQAALLAALVAVLVVTDRSDAVLRDPSRVFGAALAALVVLVPAALLALRARGASRAAIGAGFAALAVAVLAIGYPVQRHYLEHRFLNEGAAEERIPGLGLNAAYRWARGVESARIGLAGTTAGFLQYGLYGTDISNRVVYLGERGPHGAFNPIPSCRAFRAAVNDAGLDYLVTSPFLNFIDPGHPISSPEARWLRGSTAVTPLNGSGQVTVWRVRGRLDPEGCRAPQNSPLRRIPQQAPEG
jgi:hypothetical protein